MPSQTSVLLHQAQQQQHLDDTDIYASVWQDAIAAQARQRATTIVATAIATTSNPVTVVKWGGRGRGGRGIARRTLQPNDICIPDGVRLEYVGQYQLQQQQLRLCEKATSSSSSSSSSSSVQVAPLLLLENARLNFLSGHIYGMIGPNGCGKSSLLRRIDSCKIPGFPVHITTLLIQPTTSSTSFLQIHEKDNTTTVVASTTTTLQYLIQRYHMYCTDRIQAVNHSYIHSLEDAMEQLDLVTGDGADDTENGMKLNQYMEAIASYEEMIADHDCMMNDDNKAFIMNAAIVTLEFMGLSIDLHDIPYHELTTGQQSKVLLALIMLCCTISYCDLLLIDEITRSLDIYGLIQLRRIINMITSPTGENICDYYDIPFVQTYLTNPHRKPTTIILVSHDNDLLNDVVTDIIEFHTIEKKLYYYRGSYSQYLIQRQHKDQTHIHQVETLQRKEIMMQQVLQNIKSQPVHTSRGAKKKAKTISCHKKKMDKVLHSNSVNETAMVADKETVQHILRRKKYDNEPDKKVQFQFRTCINQWNEPLIMAMDIGHTYQKLTDTGFLPSNDTSNNNCNSSDEILITCKDGYIFDNIGFSIIEGGVYCILGASGCGKSTFLKLLSKKLLPTEGNIYHAPSCNIAYIDFSVPNISSSTIVNSDIEMTTLQYLMKEHPSKTEHEIRSELTNFGLGTTKQQVLHTKICFLSGGEQCRLCMVNTMLQYPYLDVLCIDNPTANLDVESVDALLYGLKKWNGTVVMCCHDCYFVRSFDETKCYVLTGGKEGKLRYVKGGIDEYIRSFGK